MRPFANFVTSGNRLKVLESELQSGKDTEMSREKQGEGLYDEALKPCYTAHIVFRKPGASPCGERVL